MSQLTVFEPFLIDILNQGLGGDSFAPLSHATIGLYNQNLSIGPDTTLDALNSASATFFGYGPKEIQWEQPSLSEAGYPQSIGVTQAWRPSDDSVDDSEFGAYIFNENGLVSAGPIDNGPVPMGSNLNVLLITTRYQPNGTMSISAQW